MPDDPETDATPTPPPRTRAGEILRESKEVGKFWAALNSDQVIKMLFSIGIIACGGIFVWQTLQFNQQQVDLAMSRDRVIESESEKLRMHCQMESDKLRMGFASEMKESRAHQLAVEKERQKGELERDKVRIAADKEADSVRMKFEADEKAKWTAAVVQIGVQFKDVTKELEEIRNVLKKWPPEFHPFPTAVAPPPKIKAGPPDSR